MQRQIWPFVFSCNILYPESTKSDIFRNLTEIFLLLKRLCILCAKSQINCLHSLTMIFKKTTTTSTETKQNDQRLHCQFCVLIVCMFHIRIHAEPEAVYIEFCFFNQYYFQFICLFYGIVDKIYYS